MARHPSIDRERARLRRHRRVRARVRGTAARPRLSVFRSKRHLLLQLVDDRAGRTLLAIREADLSQMAKKAGAQSGVAAAEALGALLAEKARAAGIQTVVFDRGGYLYHGRVRAVAEGARAGGLTF